MRHAIRRAMSDLPNKADFSHVRDWVFDLDNTLYPPAIRLFDQIEQRMNAFLMREFAVDETEARRLRTLYWREHGTTLAGLMHVHGIAPGPYLEEVHDIDLGAVVGVFLAHGRSIPSRSSPDAPA